MDTVIRGVVVYLFLLVVIRLMGKRALSQSTTFDLALLLIISEAAQQALIDTDNSMTNAALLILTLVGLDILLSLVKQRWTPVEKLIEDVPLVVLHHGKPLRKRMDKARIREGDILEAARELQGLERLDQIEYAVLERSGSITIIPKRGAE